MKNENIAIVFTDNDILRYENKDCGLDVIHGEGYITVVQLKDKGSSYEPLLTVSLRNIFCITYETSKKEER